MLVLALGPGGMRGRVMQGVIVRCIVAVDAKSDSETVYRAKQKEGRRQWERVGDIHLEANPRRGRSSGNLPTRSAREAQANNKNKDKIKMAETARVQRTL